MRKVRPFLWFDDQDEEAANRYVSIFTSRPGADGGDGPSEILQVSR
jgi:predicted 3-demethylubiquinone-9 3-methyltransferase (glyoxalase superfamily)